MSANLLAGEMITVPQAIVRVLEEAGIDRVFGMPGGHMGHIFAALEERRESVRTVMVRQESLAGVMAEVTGRLNGVPGVVMGQGSWVLGHGIIGTLEALLSSSPMLILSELSDTPGFDLHAPYQAGTGDYGVWDAKQAFAAISKQVFVARDPVAAVQATQLAIKHALAGQRGPVAVLYSRSGLMGSVGPDSTPRIYQTRYYIPALPPPADGKAVAAACDAIRAASNPVLVAGNGVRIAGAESALARFAEDAGVPVVTTATGKGVIAETHPLALGPFGTWGIAAANMAVAEADLLIVAGSKVAATDTARENPKLIDPSRQSIVHIDIEARNASWVFPAAHTLIGDVGVILDQLREGLGAPGAAGADAGRRVARIRAAHGYFDCPKRLDDSAPILPQRVIAALEQELPDDAVITCDAGENRMLVNHHYRTRATGGILQAAGAGPMGYAIPAALAVKLAEPERTAVAICGDGGFAMAMNGLLSAVEHDLHIVTVIFNNSSLGAVVHDTGPHGALFADFDYAKIAEAMGCRGIRVTEAHALGEAIRDALSAQKPAVIDVVTSADISFRDAIAAPLA